ncbi:DUF1828 domain protein [Halorubrum virus Humcor1]|nr:DUF1828 domain protein [Halorubrum virus Humcor1]
MSIEADSEDCRVTLPLERSDGDAIRLWVVQNGDQYTITDEGETYGLLYLSNINLDQERRANRVNTIQERYSLDQAKQEVKTTASADELGQRILEVGQAVQSISHLTFTRRQYTQTDFRADVGTYITELGFRYDTNPEVEGASEKHRVDFGVRGQESPTYIQALHAEDASTAKTMAQRTMYKWTEIQGHYGNKVNRISVIDDESGEFGYDSEKILRNYSDSLVPWSQRDNMLSAAITA